MKSEGPVALVFPVQGQLLYFVRQVLIVSLSISVLEKIRLTLLFMIFVNT